MIYVLSCVIVYTNYTCVCYLNAGRNLTYLLGRLHNFFFVSVRILLISYNEEILEEVEAPVFAQTPIDQTLIAHIIANLDRY